MISKETLFTILLTLLANAVAVAHPVFQDRASAPTNSKAKITGRVTAAEGRPLSRGQVVASTTNGRDAARAPTDKSGSFTLQVPAGTYRLRAERRGYVIAPYGIDSSGKGTPMTVEAGQTLAGINFRLSRGGVIMGRVIDEDNEPLVGAQVLALRKDGAEEYSGPRLLTPQTDDRGQYRIFALAPGPYLIQVRLGEITFVFSDGMGVPTEGSTVYYYPGVSSREQALEVSVSEGSETTGIDFKIVGLSRKGSLIGTVTRKDLGQPITGAVVSASGRLDGANRFSGSTDADGKYELKELPPGEYRVQIMVFDQRVSEGLASPPMQEITISNAPYELNFELERAAEISGRIILESGKPPVDVTRIFVSPYSKDRQAGGSYQSGRPDEQGNFTIKRVAGGTYQFRVDFPGGVMPYYLKSVLHEDNDVTQRGLTVQPGERLSDVLMVLSDAVGRVSGVVVAPDTGKPLPGGTVHLLPMDFEQRGQAFWNDQRASPSDQNGRYEFKSIPAGRYLVAAFSGRTTWKSVEEAISFFASRRPMLTQVEVKANETKEANLKAMAAEKP